MFLKHDDKTLNMLRLAAFGAVALYLYKVSKKEGSIAGASEGQNPLRINTKKVVDSVMPWLPIENPLAKEAIRQGLSGFADGFLTKKGVEVFKK